MTKKKTRYKSALPNFLITLACLSVCAASLWLFYVDINAFSLRTDKEQIATVTFKYKIAQRKFNDRVVWERLRQNSPLYNGDTIHTADMALATVHFTNNSSLEINENSMVQIFVADDGTLKISVSEGNVSLDTMDSAQGILLDMNGTVVNMQAGSKVSAALDDSTSGASVKVLAGAAFVGEQDEGNASFVAAGQSVNVSSSGKVEKSPVTVFSVSENQQILLFDTPASVSVPLEWFPLEDSSKKVVVETSQKKDFSVIKDTFYVDDASKVQLPATQGILYWRIRLEGEAQSVSQGKINFMEIQPVQTNWPQNKNVFTYYGGNPCITLAWKGNEHAVKYKVQISKDKEFSNIQLERETTSQSIVIEDLPDGEYFWRVIPFYEAGGIGWHGESESNNFTVAREENFQPPELSFPPDGNRISFEEREFEMDFAWKAESLEGKYTLQIARDKNFSDIILKERTTQKKLNATLSAYDFPAGKYYWNVFQIQGGKMFASAPRSFYVEKYAPQQNRLLFPADSYSVEKDKLNAVSFVWKVSKENQEEFKDKKTYLQFSSAEDFSSIDFQKETDGSELKNINLKEGKYFWRVTKGESKSDTRSIYVLNELALPQITAPAEEVFFEKSSRTPVVVRWKKTPGADFYKLKIIDKKSDSVVKEISGITHESASFDVDVLQSEQKFVVQVQAFSNETKLRDVRKSGIAQSDFVVKAISRVKLVAPVAKAQLNGIYALKDGVALKWQKDKDAPFDSTLYLWRVGAGGRLTLVKSYKNPPQSLNVGRLSSGVYRWTVKALGQNGTVLDAKETRDFTVLGVPVLPQPVLVAPVKNQIIGANYFEKNRSITFSWRAVKGATEYDFVLYHKLPNGSFRRIYSVQGTKSTQVRIRNLKIFDIGAFQWQVTARNKAKDGFVLQTAKTASQDFSIDFELPGEVAPLDPGEIYGE